MTNSFQATRLEFPVPFPDYPFGVEILVDRHHAADLLGLAHKTEIDDGLGMCDYWAFEFSCGLQALVEFHHARDFGFAKTDVPEFSHLVRHLPFDENVYWIPTDTQLEESLAFWRSMDSSFSTTLKSLRLHQVWRQDDAGNSFGVGQLTTARDANCWVKHFESLGHKQLYWHSGASSPTEPL